MGLPAAMRLGLSLAAGVAEELFFRGFLQPRIGIAASTALFVAAHVVYGYPLLLFNVTILSLVYGFLVWWRGSIWAAITAHAVFDAIQLLILLPAAVEGLEHGPV